MFKKSRFNSLHLHLSALVFVTVSIVFIFHSIYLYMEAKEEIDERIKVEYTKHIDSIVSSISGFMGSYAPYEYEKIIINIVKNQDLLAIVVEDYNMQKILGLNKYQVGYIKEGNDVIEINFDNKKQLTLLKHAYYKKTVNIINPQAQKLGEITFYISNKQVKDELYGIIVKNTILATITSLVMIFALMLALKYFVLNHFIYIVQVLKDHDKDGVPYRTIEKQGPFEIRYIIDIINSMVEAIKRSREELYNNYKTIQAEQQRYKSFLELSTDGIHIIDEDGKLYEYSESFLTMLGYTKEDAQELSIYDWDKTMSFENFYKILEELTKGPRSIETTHTRKDGSTFMAHISAKLLQIENKFYIYASSRDITTEKQHQLEIRNKLQKFIDTQRSIVILTDTEQIKFANNAFLEFFGFDNLEKFLEEHHCINEFFIKQDKFFNLENIEDQEKNWIENLIALSGRKRVVAMKDSQGVNHAFTVSINRYENDEYIVNFTDISDTINETFELTKQATVDILTKAYNRVYFNKNIEAILSAHLEKNVLTGIIIFDIDHFKNINDTYGHDIGDYILQKLVEIVQRYTRNDDKLIRWGGEEFILVCGVQDISILKKIAEYLRSMVENYQFEHVERTITCSFGCSIYDPNDTIEDTIKIADQKLYEAKENGRNGVVC